MSTVRRYVPAAIVLVLLAGAWEAYVQLRGIEEYVLPAPSDIAPEFVRMVPHLGDDVRITVIEAVVGLAVGAAAGALLAIVMALSPPIRRALYPVLVVQQAVPAIVLAPIFTLWLGFEELLPKMLVVALIGFFPVVVASVTGLIGADAERIELVRSFGATRAQVLRLVQIPEALPAFFSGLKIAATYAVVGAVIGEWMGGSHGLGLVMTRARTSFRNDRVFVAVIVVALVSLALFMAVSALARLATPWVAEEEKS
jgi:ABC-type nitrate/sulfonate/bicarbonate transport system permease component